MHKNFGQLAMSFVAGGAVVAAMGVAIGQPEGEMDMEAMMEMMRESSAPGEHHEALAPLVGEFDVEAKFWMGPGEPTVSTGHADNQWLLGKRFVGHHYTGAFMGMDFEGFGALAYHKETDTYESVWMDNFGTGILWQTGKADDDLKTITVEGEYTSAMGTTRMKNVTKIISNDKHVLEFWEPNPETGELMRTGEITYTRVDSSQ